MTRDATLQQPYPGLKPFSGLESELFFAREREIDLLTYMVIAYPEVLLYGRSGLGKSSLVHAGLLPSLRGDEHHVLPVASIVPLPHDRYEEGNPLLSPIVAQWEKGGPVGEGRARDLPGILRVMERVRGTDGGNRLRVIVLDQLEAMFAAEVKESVRQDMFHQLDQALREDVLLRLVLVLREDFLASLERYAGVLPERLRVRLEVRGLDREAAFRAMTGPVRSFGVTWEDGAIEQLIVAMSDNDDRVDPAILQVVCNLIWHRLKARNETIVSRSLVSEFPALLAEAVRRGVQVAAARHPGSKTDVGSWLVDVLTTRAGARTVVAQTPGRTHGLPNDVIDALVEGRLVRREWREGTPWIELSHDLLVPALRSAPAKAPRRRSQAARRQR